jgi:hypothetical protein
MDEYILDGIPIYNADNISTVRKYKKSFHRTGKRAELHNAGWVAVTDCTDWTECVTGYIAGAEGEGQYREKYCNCEEWI